MTFLFGALLFLAGAVAAILHPVNRLGPPLLIAGAIVIVLRAFGAVAADLPVPPPGVTSSEMRAAIANQERRQRARRAQFERLLLSPVGKGRME